jgi:serpin B
MGMDVRSPVVARRTLLAALAAVAAAPLVGCGDSTAPGGTSGKLLMADGVAWAVPLAYAPVDAVAAGMAAFGHALCRGSVAAGANWVASPLSIALAFSMARVGARGATATDLDHLFGYPARGRDDAFNAIIRSIGTVAVPPASSGTPRDASDNDPAAPIVSIGDALFPRTGLTFHPDFLKTLAAQYDTGVIPVDFSRPDAADTINAWVNGHTAGRIPHAFGPLEGDTTLVLVNTVYLKAEWLRTFIEEPVTREPFTRAAGTTVTVDMMHQTESMRYFGGPGGQAAIELPYAAGGSDDRASDLSMWLLLPAVGGDPVTMLEPATLTTVAAGLTRMPVTVSVPKWNFSTGLDLRLLMTAMGADHVFDPAGDFTGISDDIGGLTDAIHKANITVDQYGTEAAAVTGLYYDLSSTPGASASFIANRPFAFTVVNGPSHVPLFSGVVADPSAA